MNSNALIDNSAFAGLMRCYLPESDNHAKFLIDFPEHKKVDFVSVAQILTALCIYDQIYVEGSSSGHYDSSIDNISKETNFLPREQASSWANDLRKKLPNEIRSLIYTGPINSGEIMGISDNSKKLSYEIYQNNFKDNLILENNSKIPNVYSDPTYIDRKYFLELNAESQHPLNDNQLTHAMFLHRGLLLDAIASENKLCYIPYLYRGKLLEALPPGTSLKILINGNFDLHQDLSPNQNKIIEELSKIYYETLQQFTWTKYDNFIPFIGSSILSQVKYNIADAFEMTLEFREKSNIREFITEINDWSSDKIVFEHYLNHYRSDLSKATKHFKIDTSTSKIETMANLTMFWLPDGFMTPIMESLKFLPEKWRIYFNSLFNIPELNNGHQMLLFDHVYALKRIDLEMNK